MARHVFGGHGPPLVQQGPMMAPLQAALLLGPKKLLQLFRQRPVAPLRAQPGSDQPEHRGLRELGKDFANGCFGW